MNKETLQRATQLEEEISGLKKHYDSVKTEAETPYEGKGAEMYVEPRNSQNQKRLRSDFLPVALPEFIEMYLVKVEKQIKKLEKEFEKL